METTRRRLLSVNLSFALLSAFSYLFAYSISSSAFRSVTLPISRRYCLTGSVDSIPSRRVRSSISLSNFSFEVSTDSPSSETTDSKTSIPSESNESYKSSSSLIRSSASGNISKISS